MADTPRQQLERCRAYVADLTADLADRDRRLAALTRERDEARARGSEAIKQLQNAAQLGIDRLVELQAAEGQIAAVRAYCAKRVRPEQAADYVLSRAGFSEREIQISIKVSVEAVNQERNNVLALLPPTPATPPTHVSTTDFRLRRSPIEQEPATPAREEPTNERD